MNQAYSITKNEIHIRFSYEKNDIKTCNFMNSEQFEYLPIFFNHLKNSKQTRKTIIINRKNISDDTVSGIVMWFIFRDMYNTPANELIYKKVVDGEKYIGYSLSKQTFEGNSTYRLKNFLLNKCLSFKFIKI